MSHQFAKTSLCLSALLLAVLGLEHTPAKACVIIGGGSTKVDGEEVLIVWDAPHHEEHFIRHMQFKDAAADFGFMVPTPTRPELGDVDDAVFERLFEIYKRPVRERPSHSVARNADGLVAAAAALPPVTVVEQRRVAGLDATVLAATDAAALNAWLGAHHYPSTPTMTAYLAPYVQQHFYVTAFRYTRGSGTDRLGTRAVRMSFTADRPFFPYAEPTDAPRVAGRVFRISVVSSERVAAQVGTRPWGARTGYADHPSGLGEALHGVVPPAELPQHAWLTTFQEDTSIRGRDDLFFVRAPEQTRVASTIDHAIGDDSAATE